MNCRICSSPTRRVFDLRSQRHDVTVPVMRCKACDAYSSDGDRVNYDDVDWLRKALGAVPCVRNQVMRPQLDLFSEGAEHLNVLCRHAMGKLAHGVGLEVLPARFHHSRVFDNAAFRTFGLDEGYYFMKTRGEPR